MDRSIIDTHVHVDMYKDEERQLILQELESSSVDALISVSNHLPSAEMNLKISRTDKRVRPAFGFHPEQDLPGEYELEALLQFIERHHEEMVAIGEVGLPYYLRKKNSTISIEPYMEVLEQFIRLSVDLDKPIVLHAVYQDAPIVCDLLEKYSVEKAHFHWFKGNQKTVDRIQQNGYVISIAPDVLYEKEIQQLVTSYPLSQMMVETDGPWPFEGVFRNRMTHPNMIHPSLHKIAELKKTEINDVYHQIYRNSCSFYML